MSNDESASEVLKCVHYLSGMLGITVNVEHEDCVSTEMAKLADEFKESGQWQPRGKRSFGTRWPFRSMRTSSEMAERPYGGEKSLPNASE